MTPLTLVTLSIALVVPIAWWWAARWWVKPRGAGMVFYDGTCGFCQGWVRFLVCQDRKNQLLYAPLHGAAWREHALSITADSVAVYTSDRRTLVTWQAIRFLAAALGGPWRVAGWFLILVPSRCGEYVYSRIAARRYRLAKKPTGNCPILSVEARTRFDLRP